MASRTKQKPEDRRQQIIDAALKVFGHKGFEKATNKDIARAAGIGSPGLIYYYFKDKKDLLRQVFESYLPVVEIVAHAEDMMALPPREALTRLGRAFLQVLENPEALAMMKLILGEAIRQPKVASMLDEAGPSRGISFLARYLQAQIESGTLRPLDPPIAARCFIGPLVTYVIQREILHQADLQNVRAEEMLAATVETFLRGMQPAS